MGVAAGSWGLNFWQMMKVGKARKALNVEYPKMYSEDKPLFNCVMRAHQNTLENLPHFLTLLMLSGMKYPRYAAGAGLVWLVGRVIYSIGYYTGEPKNRYPGFLVSHKLCSSMEKFPAIKYLLNCDLH